MKRKSWGHEMVVRETTPGRRQLSQWRGDDGTGQKDGKKRTEML